MVTKNYTNCMQSYNFFNKKGQYYWKSCIFARLKDNNGKE